MKKRNSDSGKERKRREAHRKKQNRRRKRAHLILVLMLLIIACLAGLVVYLYIRISRDYDTPLDYQVPAAEAADDYDPFNLETGESYADKLVVSDNNVNRDSVTLTGNNEHMVLFNLETKEPLIATGIYEQSYPASLTKLMTAYCVRKYGDMDQMVTIKEEDLDLTEGAQASGLQAGDSLTVDKLLHIALVYSGNDAALALARTVSGSVSAFVDQMNKEAARIGMTGTHYVNPTGLHDDNHYTTPYDIYLIMNTIQNEYPELNEISQLPQYVVEYKTAAGQDASFVLYATDEYLSGLRQLPEGLTILQSKTGTTEQAGACLSLILQNSKGTPFVAIDMGAGDHELLYQDMTTLLKMIPQE